MTQTLLKAYLSKTQQDLNILKEQQAKFGHNPPIELRNQIQDYETAVVLTRRALVNELTEIEWRQALKQLRVPQPPISSRARWHQLPVIFKTLVIGLFFIGLMVVSGLFLVLSNDIQAMRQPNGLLSAFWPVPTPTQPPMPDNFFNIGVAQFTQVNERSQMVVTADSQDFSNWLFTAIEGRIRLSQGVYAHVRGPDQIGPVYGEESATRALEAAQVADQHNVVLLIHGVITHRSNSYQVEPEFYLVREGFDYGREITGPNRLGQAIPFELPLDSPGTLKGLNTELNARVLVLYHLVDGLAHFFYGNYDQAWAKFFEASVIEGWEEEEGQEVVYLLRGAARLHAYGPRSAPELRIQALNQAFVEFNRASKLNPDYARSYLGLGAVVFQQATMVDPADNDKLFEAAAWYGQSLNASDQPALADVPVKAAFALGQVHLKGYEEELPGWSSEKARHYFNQVITAHNLDQSSERTRLAGHAYAYLGWLAGHDDQDWKAMSFKCRTAIDILTGVPGKPPDDWIALYWTWIAEAEKKLGRLDEACAVYRRAVVIGEPVLGPRTQAFNPEDLAKWRSELDRCDKGVP